MQAHPHRLLQEIEELPTSTAWHRSGDVDSGASDSSLEGTCAEFGEGLSDVGVQTEVSFSPSTIVCTATDGDGAADVTTPTKSGPADDVTANIVPVPGGDAAAGDVTEPSGDNGEAEGWLCDSKPRHESDDQFATGSTTETAFHYMVFHGSGLARHVPVPYSLTSVWRVEVCLMNSNN